MYYKLMNTNNVRWPSLLTLPPVTRIRTQWRINPPYNDRGTIAIPKVNTESSVVWLAKAAVCMLKQTACIFACKRQSWFDLCSQANRPADLHNSGTTGILVLSVVWLTVSLTLHQLSGWIILEYNKVSIKFNHAILWHAEDCNKSHKTFSTLDGIEAALLTLYCLNPSR
jgi:hypothetical protein